MPNKNVVSTETGELSFPQVQCTAPRHDTPPSEEKL
jgi:hypothetical protein